MIPCTLYASQVGLFTKLKLKIVVYYFELASVCMFASSQVKLPKFQCPWPSTTGSLLLHLRVMFNVQLKFVYYCETHSYNVISQPFCHRPARLVSFYQSQSDAISWLTLHGTKSRCLESSDGVAATKMSH